MKFLSLIATYVPPNSGQAPPGTENVNTVITWILWGAGAALFVYFIVGVVQAAKARKRGGEADMEAPTLPLILAIVLGAAGTIWNAIT